MFLIRVEDFDGGEGDSGVEIDHFDDELAVISFEDETVDSFFSIRSIDFLVLHVLKKITPIRSFGVDDAKQVGDKNADFYGRSFFWGFSRLGRG